MADGYVPTLDSFVLTDQELAIITEALQKDDPWDHDGNQPLKAIKDRMLQYHLQRHGDTCCYCREPLHGRGPFTTDREHILPKGKYKSLTFDMSNLSVACKRCNMEYKKDRTDFVVDPDTIALAYTDSGRYLFVHPNFDNWSDHLRRLAAQVDNVEIIYFQIRAASPKGIYTSDFFKLDRYAVDSMDLAQGIERLDEEGRIILQQLANSLNFELP